MDNLAVNSDITDSLLKLRLENLSKSARGKREKNREFKPLVSNKEIEEYRFKILKSRQGQAKYNVPPEVELGNNFLEEKPELEEVLAEDKKEEYKQLKNKTFNEMQSIEKQFDERYNLLKRIKDSITDVYLSNYSINEKIDRLVNDNLNKDPNEVVELYLEKLYKDKPIQSKQSFKGSYLANSYNFFDKFLRAIQSKILCDYLIQYFKVIDPNDELNLDLNENFFYDGSYFDESIGFMFFPNEEEIQTLANKVVNNDYKSFEDNLLTNYKKLLDESSTNYNQLSYWLTETERREKDNKAKIDNTNKINKERLDNYTNMMNFLNVNQLNVQRMPNESDEQFLERLKDISTTMYDDEYIETYAVLETLEELKNNLKKIVKDNALIEDVIKEITETGLRFELNKNFERIKTNFIKSYGVNNKNLTSKDIKDFLLDQLNKIKESSGPAINLQNEIEDEDEEQTRTRYTPFENSLKVIIESNEKFSEGESYKFNNFSFSKDTSANALLILNTSGLQTLFIKYNPKGEIFINNDAGDIGTYNLVNFNNDDYSTNDMQKRHRWMNYIDYVGLGAKFNKDDTDLINSILPRSNQAKNKKIIVDFLKNKVGILASASYRVEEKTITRDGIPYDIKFETPIGMGVNTPYDIPKGLVKYGNIKINLHKLYYKNILSIRDNENKYMQNFKNTPVSDDLVSYIVKVFYKEPTNDSDYKKLKKSEIELLDQLNFVAGLGKQKNVNKEDYVDKLKNELELITGSIMAGNNNTKLLDELRDVLNKLVSFNAVSLQSSKKYINQFKTQFK